MGPMRFCNNAAAFGVAMRTGPAREKAPPSRRTAPSHQVGRPHGQPGTDRRWPLITTPPRKNDDESNDDSIEELKGRRNEAATPAVDEDEAEAADSYELPGADLSGEELSVRVLPRQADEFTCASCFLVKHRSQIDHVEGTLIICKECAA